MANEAEGARPIPAAALLRYFLRLGTTGFGGPVALVGYMQRDLVERRGWYPGRIPRGLAWPTGPGRSRRSSRCTWAGREAER